MPHPVVTAQDVDNDIGLIGTAHDPGKDHLIPTPVDRGNTMSRIVGHPNLHLMDHVPAGGFRGSVIPLAVNDRGDRLLSATVRSVFDRFGKFAGVQKGIQPVALELVSESHKTSRPGEIPRGLRLINELITRPSKDGRSTCPATTHPYVDGNGTRRNGSDYHDIPQP